MSELKECPFCGDDNAYYSHSCYKNDDEAERDDKWVVCCQRCTVGTSVPMHCKEFAAETWNRRTSTPNAKIQELIDEWIGRNKKHGIKNQIECNAGMVLSDLIELIKPEGGL